MARKESITKKMVLDSAFEYLRDNGIEEATARKLAAYTGCSTQPFFRLYPSMEALYEDLFSIALDFYERFYLEFERNSTVPFVNLGMAYIAFAQKEPKLFSFIFLSQNRYGKSLYEILNGTEGILSKEIQLAKDGGCKDAMGMFMKMWMFIHGAAAMAITGDYDLGLEETRELLEDSYKRLV